MKLAFELCELVSEIYGPGAVALHRPVFSELETEYLADCIRSNFVSSVGQYVSDFEDIFAEYCQSEKAIACVNGTTALHAALVVNGVQSGSEVLTQAVSFVATANSIAYCGAEPIFIDVDLDTLGMSPNALRSWLDKYAEIGPTGVINKRSRKEISACVPMHTFGIPCRVQEILQICNEYNIPLIEDAAESLGSRTDGKHVGNFGTTGVFSFNGNKIITTGGGGMIVTSETEIALRLKHLTTTAKKSHPYEYYHDEIGFNYRLPNLNAAVGVAQMMVLDKILERKKDVAARYYKFFDERDVNLIRPSTGSISNNWLNAIVLNCRKERDEFLKITNDAGVMTRPIWALLSELPMYRSCQNDGLMNSKWLSDRVVNIPSSVPRLD